MVLSFDNDANHPMETVLMGHPERVMPYCVRHFQLVDGNGKVLHRCPDNHQTRREVIFAPPITTETLTLKVLAMHGPCPAAVFEIRCYEH